MKSVECFVENVPKTTHRTAAVDSRQNVNNIVRPKTTPTTKSIKQRTDADN